MALEVNEIGISVRVTSDAKENNRDQSPGGDGPSGGNAREEIVEECIKRVLQALKLERER